MLNGLMAIGVSGFIPHGHCYLWKPGLVGLHLTSDVLIGLAYLSISMTLVDLVRRIQLPFRSMFLAFGLFIAACGATHFMSVLTLWHPVYWLSGGVKVITALSSVATAVLLPPLVPQAVVLAQSAALAEERRLQLEIRNQEIGGLYQRVKELDQIKTQFFANVSHELRTPLMLVLGLTQRLCQQVVTAPEPAIAPEQVNDLVMIDRNARTLLKQVNDLLDVAKLEAGQMQLCYSEADLSGVIRLTAAYFETIAHDRQISFSVTAPPSLSAQIDSEKLERVVLNLLSNAFKVVSTGGKVLCRLEQQDDRALITVEDNGPGVAVELRQIIFERFQQGNPAESRGGTGLGLAIAREFVELHHGTIAVETAPEGGASFIVTLPRFAPAEVTVTATEAVGDRQLLSNQAGINAAQQALAALQTASAIADPALLPSESPSEPDSRPLVLVVEDNPDMRQFIQKSLSVTYQVATASDGQQGLEAAIALRPDLVLTDLMMPQMNGDVLVRELRSHPELDTTPIVLLTARADSELQVKLLQDGAQDYLMKPVLLKELEVRVANLIAIKQIREVLQQELATQSHDVAILANTATLSKQELQQALAALRQSESRFRRVTESNMIGILFWDAEGNITEANDTFLATFGYTQEDLRSGKMCWKEMTPSEYEPIDQQALAELRATGTCVPFEKEYICKDGSRIPVLIGAAMLEGWRDSPDPLERGVAFVLDITQRKRAEAALQQAYEQLELRVEQRTQELSCANANLQAEIAERQRIEADLRISRASIQKLYEVVADPKLDFDGKIQQLLILGCDRFQLEIGILNQLTGSHFKVVEIYQDVSSGAVPLAIVPGDQIEINNLYCFQTIQSSEPVSFEQAAILPEWKDHLCYVATRLETYIGTPISVNGETYGTLSFSSSIPRTVAFSAGDKKFLQLMAQWIGSEIARQQTETALVKEQEFMKVLLDNVNAAIVACDAAGVLTLFNQAARDFHGLIEQSLLPEQWSEYYDLYQPDGITPMAKHDIPLFRAWQGERIHNLEMKIVPRSSPPRDLLTSAQAIADPQGKILGAVAVMHDITDRKQAESQIRIFNAELEQRVFDRTAELEAANRAKDELLVREQAARAEAETVNRMKDEFLATLSHELRTPLNAILGWSQLLRNRKFDEATTTRALETIERNARSQSQLVGDILEVSSIIRGKVRLNIQPLAVMPLIEAALDSVRLAAESKAIQITSHSDPQIDIISGDPDRLQQVFWNLLSNAIKFTPVGGRVEVWLTQTNRTVNIAVSDTGQGISSDFLPRVFDRFRQADGSINRQHGGLGLGLAIVRHLVELHGGTVWATSAGIGAGATFTVELPLNSRKIRPSVSQPVGQQTLSVLGLSPDSEATLLANLNILVVEDDEDAREFLTILLEQEGATVIAVDSVVAALEVLSASPTTRYPNLLISDIGMPEQDGYTLIRQVRSLAANHQVTLPAIALTAYASAEDETQLLQAGFDQHIPKPADPDKLIASDYQSGTKR